MSRPLGAGLAGVRIRVLDDDDVELCDVEGCITVYHRGAVDVNGDHADEPDPGTGSSAGGEPPWVESTLRFVSGVPGLRRVTTDHPLSMAIVDPTTSGEQVDPMTVHSVGHTMTFNRSDSLSAQRLADDGSNFMLDRVVHIVAFGNRLGLSALRPLREALGDSAEIAITMVRSTDE